MARRPSPVRAKSCFLALPRDHSDAMMRRVIGDALEHNRVQILNVDEFSLKADATVFSAVAAADFVVADVSSGDLNVFFQLGMAQTMGKATICLSDRPRSDLHLGTFEPLEFIDYKGDYNLLYQELDRHFKGAYSLRQNRSKSVANTRLPFFIDWDLLDPREIENLCQELLAQMGFRRVRWDDSVREVDLIAEFPRKDPDGFEFRELWLVSMGQRMSQRKVLEMATADLSYFLHRISTYSEKFARENEARPMTLLVISLGDDDLLAYEERIERSPRFRPDQPHQFRVRVWDRVYLTSLVQSYPNIGYKYFSNEGRARSQSRRSFEELYRENVDLVNKQRFLISELNSEKSKRVRAERDAVWKDISFSAAHKIGNPIFAIETGLTPLVTRIKHGRLDEAVEIAEIIGTSVNKAKSVVEQFKSLAKSQQIDPVPVPVRPLIDGVAKGLVAQQINCSVESPPELTAFCDADKISECFDELSMNAIRWMEKSGKAKELWRINIVATDSANRQLPDSIDATKKYVVINFRDNGTGVLVEQKTRIFDAFVTDYEHGTGLGLALVRRIIEAHGGAIIEVGKPDEGADFEFYLPASEPQIERPIQQSAEN